MSYLKYYWSRPLSLLVLCLAVCALTAENAWAQEPPPDPSQNENPEKQERIVEGRPAGYALKRALHPVTWIDAGLMRPVYNLAYAGIGSRLNGTSSPGSKPGRGWIGVGGAGAGSGFGPVVTPLNLHLGSIEIETPLLYTYKRYELYQANLRLPVNRSGEIVRTSIYLSGSYRSRPLDNFFGLGGDSQLENETQFRTVNREAAIGFSTHFTQNLKTSIQFGYQNIGVTDPFRGDSAQDRFTDSTVPGLSTGAVLRATSIAVDRDTRDDDDRPTTGGYESVKVTLVEGVGKGDFSYWKYHADLQRFFVLSSDHRKVIAVRAMAETNQEKGGSRVPFFDMPAIGTSGTLRGFDNYRFRDKSAMSFAVEYRYRIWRALDWGLFVDKGQVAPELGDFAWNRFRTGYGARLMILPNPKLPVTVDVARSNERWRLYFNLTPSF